MEKKKLERFISKYNLSGLVESVKWTSSDESLSTSFISDDKSVLGKVEMENFKQGNYDFGVYDTSKLIKMMKVLGDNVDMSVADIDGRPISLELKDSSSSINYMMADLSVIPNVPDLKELPNFDVTIKLDNKFINRFISATAALSDDEKFTFEYKKGSGCIILGYSSINTNRISIDVECETDKEEIEPISFSSTYLKEILVANKDTDKALLSLSTQGLAFIEFDVDDYKSSYYLVELH